MTTRSPLSIGTATIAFCASLVVHGALLIYAANYFVRSIGMIHLDGFSRSDEVHEAASPIFLLPKITKSDEQLGETDGTGNSADNSTGDELLQARKADQTQAFLSRDPEGAGPMHAMPSPSLAPAGGGGGAPAASNAPAQPEQREIPFGVATIDGGPLAVGEPQPRHESHASAQSSVVSNDPSPSPSENAAAPGAAVAPADPAPQAETESDPFSVIGSAQFHPGRTKAQIGRQHKLVAPRIGMAGIIDGQEMGSVRVILQLTIDPTGNVRRAKIFKSSGSENIDQACRVAAYQWWFEPRKELAEKSKEETFLFVISFT